MGKRLEKTDEGVLNDILRVAQPGRTRSGKSQQATRVACDKLFPRGLAAFVDLFDQKLVRLPALFHDAFHQVNQPVIR